MANVPATSLGAEIISRFCGCYPGYADDLAWLVSPSNG